MNYYEILEVSSSASKEVIKNAYRALVKKYHPDSYTGNKDFAQEKIKEINKAYETLIDDNKRLLYDYDNGFKIDPNVQNEEPQIAKREPSQTYNVYHQQAKVQTQPKRETKVTNDETEQEESYVEDESKIKKFFKELMQNKGLLIFAIVLLFLIAFFIGLIIENLTEDDTDEEEENTTVQVEENTDDDDNEDSSSGDTYNNYYYNNYSNDDEDADTNINNSIKEEPSNKNENNTMQPNNSNINKNDTPSGVS